MIAAPLTMSAARKRVIDFSAPFMSLGLTILYKPKKGKEVPFEVRHGMKILVEPADASY